MKFDNDIWMPQLLFTLQTMSHMYPTNPNDVAKKKYYQAIYNLPLFFPHYPFGGNFSTLLDKYPLSPYLSSRESFIKWVHFISNKLYECMNWDRITFTNSLNKYYDSYKPARVIKHEEILQTRKYVTMYILISLIFIAAYILKP
jgi:hypothetical protein